MTTTSFQALPYFCSNHAAVNKFFEKLRAKTPLNEYGDIVFEGYNLKGDHKLKLTFFTSTALFGEPGSYRDGVFELRIIAPDRFDDLITYGAFKDGYKNKGQLKSSYFTSYLEWKLDGSMKFYYDTSGELIKVSYKRGRQSYVFIPELIQ